MEYKFLSYSKLIRINTDPSNLNADSNNYIGSVSDLLYIMESHKKGFINTNRDQLFSCIELVCDTEKNQGRVYFSEFDHYCLKNNLFDDDELDSLVCDKLVSPRHSISRIVLKINDAVWWEQSLFDEMEEWYASAEGREIS